MTEYDQILKSLKDNGIEKTLSQINIDQVKDYTLQIILRTLKYNHFKIFEYLEKEVAKTSKNTAKR